MPIIEYINNSLILCVKMEDKFSPKEILDYLHLQITPDTPISKKLSLYTQAIQNQLDNSKTSLHIWLEYINVIYENEQDVKTVQDMFKMLISSFGRYLKFWKAFIEFMRINGSEKRIVEKYRDIIKMKNYEEKESILTYFEDIFNDRYTCIVRRVEADKTETQIENDNSQTDYFDRPREKVRNFEPEKQAKDVFKKVDNEHTMNVKGNITYENIRTKISDILYDNELSKNTKHEFMPFKSDIHKSMDTKIKTHDISIDNNVIHIERTSECIIDQNQQTRLENKYITDTSLTNRYTQSLASENIKNISKLNNPMYQPSIIKKPSKSFSYEDLNMKAKMHTTGITERLHNYNPESRGFRTTHNINSTFGSKMDFINSNTFYRSRPTLHTPKTGHLNTHKLRIQNISDEIDKISLEIKKPTISRNPSVNCINLGVETANIELDYFHDNNPHEVDKENIANAPANKHINNVVKTKLEVNTQDIVPSNVYTCQSTLVKKDSSSSLLNSEKINKKEIILNDTSYTIIGIAGKGGFGIVLKVLKNDSIYALKKIDILGMEEHIIKAYMNEIDILKRLKSYDQVIKMYDYEITEENILILMEYGKIDLLQEFKRIKELDMSVDYLRSLWEQLINCVKVIHENKIIHRDLKPANFIVVDGNIKIIDFGISKKIRGDTTNVNVDKTMGTMIYMAPETIKNIDSKINRKSDIWSLGCILYESLYGYPPFKSIGNGINAMNCIVDENHIIEFPEISQNHVHLINIIRKCLIRDVKKRSSIQEIYALICENLDINRISVPKTKLKRLIKTLLQHNSDKNINIDVQVESIYNEFIRKI